MAISLDNILGLSAQALVVREKRSEVLANNIANSDTPGFKARDMDFSEVMGRLEQGRSPSSELQTSNPRHISDASSSGSDALLNDLKFRIPLNPSLDGNTVDSQVEASAYTENAINYQASLRFISGRISTLMSAIKGE